MGANVVESSNTKTSKHPTPTHPLPKKFIFMIHGAKLTQKKKKNNKPKQNQNQKNPNKQKRPVLVQIREDNDNSKLGWFKQSCKEAGMPIRI